MRDAVVAPETERPRVATEHTVPPGEDWRKVIAAMLVVALVLLLVVVLLIKASR